MAGKLRCYYDILGVKKDASPAEIKKAFRKLVLEHHPDKGGDSQKVMDLMEAREVLTDSEKRKEYDEFVEEAEKEEWQEAEADYPFDISEPFTHWRPFQDPETRKDYHEFGQEAKQEKREEPDAESPSDVLESFTDWIPVKEGSGSGDCERKKGPNRYDYVEVDLEDFYNGALKRVACKLNRICGKCKDREGWCHECDGRKIVQERKVFEIQIEKGMEMSPRFYFAGEGDESLSADTGDLVISVLQKKHPEYERANDDLLIDRYLSESEAQSGFEFMLQLLDNRFHKVYSKPGKVYKTGDSDIIEGEGMPLYKMEHKKGNLHITYKVISHKGAFYW